MKAYIYSIFLLFLTISVTSQEKSTRFFLSGFKVHLIQSPNYYVKYDPCFPVDINVFEDSITSISVIDQTGKIPKSSIEISIDNLEYIYLHNCLLEMDTYFVCDTLECITGCAVGELKLHVKYLKLNIGGGSRFYVSGNTDFLDCAAGAGSLLDASALYSDSSDVNVMGRGSIILNSKMIRNSIIENSYLKNICK